LRAVGGEKRAFAGRHIHYFVRVMAVAPAPAAVDESFCFLRGVERLMQFNGERAAMRERLVLPLSTQHAFGHLRVAAERNFPIAPLGGELARAEAIPVRGPLRAVTAIATERPFDSESP
jgi:hypothetical protein